MGKIFDGIDAHLASWISAQPSWFVATAPLALDGRVNVSPRGHDTFSILNSHRVAWVDYAGSGVETIAHLRENVGASGAGPPKLSRTDRGACRVPTAGSAVGGG